MADDLDALSRQAAELQGQSVAVVTSAAELSDEQQSTLESKLASIYGREMTVHVQVDPADGHSTEQVHRGRRRQPALQPPGDRAGHGRAGHDPPELGRRPSGDVAVLAVGAGAQPPP